MSEDTYDADSLIAEARRVLRIEAEALTTMMDRVDGEFVRAVGILEDASGRVIVSGIGKSGIVGRKIAATLTSTGSAAIFLHPVEGLHGDLGIVTRDDAVIFLSKSGSTSELVGLVDYLARLGVPIVLLTGDPESPLAQQAKVVLDCSVEEEACPMDLAPTSSTTAMLAMGDALAVALLQRRGFKAEDFAQLHPGGALGRKLSLRVEEAMEDSAYPSLRENASIRDCIVPLAEQRGTVPIVDGQSRVVGIITAGDLTRLMEQEPDFLSISVTDVMNTDPKTVTLGELGSAAVHKMEEHRIMAMPVVDEDGKLHGVLHLHDLLRSGAV